MIGPLMERMQTIWTDLTLRYGEQFGEMYWDEDEGLEQEGSTTFIEVISVGTNQIESFFYKKHEKSGTNF